MCFVCVTLAWGTAAAVQLLQLLRLRVSGWPGPGSQSAQSSFDCRLTSKLVSQICNSDSQQFKMSFTWNFKWAWGTAAAAAALTLLTEQARQAVTCWVSFDCLSTSKLVSQTAKQYSVKALQVAGITQVQLGTWPSLAKNVKRQVFVVALIPTTVWEQLSAQGHTTRAPQHRRHTYKCILLKCRVRDQLLATNYIQFCLCQLG